MPRSPGPWETGKGPGLGPLALRGWPTAGRMQGVEWGRAWPTEWSFSRPAIQGESIDFKLQEYRNPRETGSGTTYQWGPRLLSGVFYTVLLSTLWSLSLDSWCMHSDTNLKYWFLFIFFLPDFLLVSHPFRLIRTSLRSRAPLTGEGLAR